MGEVTRALIASVIARSEVGVVLHWSLLLIRGSGSLGGEGKETKPDREILMCIFCTVIKWLPSR